MSPASSRISSRKSLRMQKMSCLLNYNLWAWFKKTFNKLYTNSRSIGNHLNFYSITMLRVLIVDCQMLLMVFLGTLQLENCSYFLETARALFLISGRRAHQSHFQEAHFPNPGWNYSCRTHLTEQAYLQLLWSSHCSRGGKVTYIPVLNKRYLQSHHISYLEQLKSDISEVCWTWRWCNLWT